MSTRLAVFDFDQTIVAEDSDSAVARMLSEWPPLPDDLGVHDWTPYMQRIFGLVHEAGWTKEDILARIGGIAPVVGAVEIISTLAERGWDVILLTDANSVFVNHWLKVHDLLDKVDRVITNPARWSRDGRLLVAPYTRQTLCAGCPSNLCKALVLRAYRRERGYRTVLYAGDGSNDACPMSTLGEGDIACPRIGFPCHKILSASPPLPARVIPWRDHYDILTQLFPDYAPTISGPPPQ